MNHLSCKWPDQVRLPPVANKNPQVKGDFEVRVPNYGDEEDENTQELTELDGNFAMTQELETKLNSIRETRQKIKEGTYQLPEGR